jgi:epoxyqueuosine reductase
MNPNPEGDELLSQIKAEAFRLGFSLFGVTAADPPEHYPLYENWLDQGCHGGMGYLDSTYHREARKHPASLLEGAKSIIVLGWSYSLTRSPAKPTAGLIAGYALQPDYHDHLPQLMAGLVEFIHHSTAMPFQAKCLTDSAPVLERELGQRAGLGWIGRNSCLISPEWGSAFLLAEILLTLDLPVSQSFNTDRCGTCRRCIDACPTACIRSDRTLDANRCISYLTIENKGAIPVELREKLGSWVFGCDICQEVCPWNTKQMKNEQKSSLSAGLSPEQMIESLQAAPDDFEHQFQGSPILRAKWAGYQRNLIAVLTNMQEKKALSVFTDLFENETTPDQRELLQWALDKLT